LKNPKQPQLDVKLVDNFWLKDNRYSLNDMFGGKKYNKEELAKNFEGGTVYQAFLSALSYHRWHSPVDGVIEDIYAIDGTYYLDQSQFIPYDEASQTNSQSFITAVAARKLIVINTHNPKIGKIAIIFVGMA
jgi:phosphatidylserine decarboxylase